MLFQRLKMNDTRDILGAKMSTGMKQKVSVARAVIHDPPVLIFDEATAGLDVLVARALLQTVAESAITASASSSPRTSCARPNGFATAWPSFIAAHFGGRDAEEMRDRHHQRDLEELFFQLISQHDTTYQPACSLT